MLDLDLPNGVVASIWLSAIKIIQDETALKLYQFNTRLAKHYFWSVGSFTNDQCQSCPYQYNHSDGRLEDVNPFDLAFIALFGGVTYPSNGQCNAASVVIA